ncbi:ornithine cyclodeaminase family protein [Microvirga aerilata]|uniref:Ornithine cyclodeaminase family protein n=1 Tax=Microvirga aerilata TaxID=670292 RepID=A0A936ZFT2_9HYPH|nr:ornithine cyclodeaminase family protein [Microvirga aerilata]MBL0406159.1 ornithine cyclodeaminase family protein [Microvirga aerilata]
MRFVGAELVHGLLDWTSTIAALREAHRGEVPETGRVTLKEDRAEGQPNILLTIPAWQPGRALGAKLVTSFPGNMENHGVPTVNALYVVFHPVTGVPLAIIDGEALIFRKTAADSALGASYLARKDVQTLLMVGAGALAPYLVRAHINVRPSLRRVCVWNRTYQRAEALSTQLRAEGIDAEVVDDLKSAISAADVISSATMSEEPLIKGELVKSGTHVDLVGSFTPSMREANDEMLRRARIFVDTYGCLERSGEFTGPIARGVISASDIQADLFAFCTGRHAGRESVNEITLYKNAGAGHLDLFIAHYLMERLG